jgi:hypothetical protein
MGELRSESGSGGNLKQNLRQVHTRQSGVHCLTQANQARRIVQFVEAGQDQFFLAV